MLAPKNNIKVYIETAEPLVFPPSTPINEIKVGVVIAIPITKNTLIIIINKALVLIPINVSPIIESNNEPLRTDIILNFSTNQFKLNI